MEKEEKKKGEGIVVHATIPVEQFKAISSLDGTLGTGINGVVANIINMWLYNQEWFSDIAKSKVKKGEEK